MKQHPINQVLAFVFTALTMSACNDFLDKEPESTISPEIYFTSESQLRSYADGLYTDILPSHENWSYGTFGEDKHTDNQADMYSDNRFVPGQWKTEQKETTNWYFNRIYSCNYFLKHVLPKYEEHLISGSDANIKHYIGEIYFLRAHEYFKRYQLFGDFPIVTEPLPDNLDELVSASKRAPRNEVARFILNDLDKAIELMVTTPDANKTRINRESALLLKSRVALYEGTWLKYFKGTAFVPGNNEWPGAKKEYHHGFSFAAGSIEQEINWFLQQSMDAAEACAQTFSLVENTGLVQQSANDPVNPYMNMFGDEDLKGYSEVLLWRQYDVNLSTHCVVVAAQFGDYGVGVTRGLVNGFLMANGLPVYAAGSGYAGDDYISDIRKDRDSRLSCFLKEPGQRNILFSGTGSHFVDPEPIPDITSGSKEKKYTTGLALRKGGSYDQNQCGNGASFTGSITFRGAEAYLNYIEACYEANGNLDNTASMYWQALRSRANVDIDFSKTINATDMAEEAKWDWGAYSAGQLVDPTLFNIRRERRSELMAEGLRYMDLRRWRAMDQLITAPYHIEGFKLWGPMLNYYDQSSLIYEGGGNSATPNVSSPSLSDYLRPYEVVSNSLTYSGYKWVAAHYLTPLPIQEMLLTAGNQQDLSSSPLYQNPGWPMVANQGPDAVSGF